MKRLDYGSEDLIDNAMMTLGYPNFQVFKTITDEAKDIQVQEGIDLESATGNQVNQISDVVRSVIARYGIVLNPSDIRKISYGVLASLSL